MVLFVRNYFLDEYSILSFDLKPLTAEFNSQVIQGSYFYFYFSLFKKHYVFCWISQNFMSETRLSRGFSKL